MILFFLNEKIVSVHPVSITTANIVYLLKIIRHQQTKTFYFHNSNTATLLIVYVRLSNYFPSPLFKYNSSGIVDQKKIKRKKF